MTLDEARADLESAKSKHAATLDGLRVAKEAFFASGSDLDRKRVVTAEDAARATALVRERAEFHVANAQREAGEQARAANVRRLEALQAADAERVALEVKNRAELVAIERTASALLQANVSAAEARARDFHELKTLTLALDPAAIVRPPPPAGTARHALQLDIAKAQNAEGRYGRDSCIVADWLQPAPHIFDKSVGRSLV